MGRLNGPVDLLFILGQLIKIPLHGGRQGLNHVLQGILIGSAIKIKEKRRHFRIRQKLWIEILLAQIFRHGMVIGKIAVVHQGFVESHKGMGACRMPDFALGGVSLVGDPHMGLKVVQLIVFHHFFRISHDFENNEIPSVAQHKGMLVSVGVVEGLVDVEAVLINKFVLNPSQRRSFKTVFFRKVCQDFRFHPYKITEHLGGLHIQPPNIPVVRHMGDTF